MQDLQVLSTTTGEAVRHKQVIDVLSLAKTSYVGAYSPA